MLGRQQYRLETKEEGATLGSVVKESAAVEETFSTPIIRIPRYVLF